MAEQDIIKETLDELKVGEVRRKDTPLQKLQRLSPEVAQ